jgi:hypothetical protein
MKITSFQDFPKICVTGINKKKKPDAGWNNDYLLKILINYDAFALELGTVVFYYLKLLNE